MNTQEYASHLTEESEANKIYARNPVYEEWTDDELMEVWTSSKMSSRFPRVAKLKPKTRRAMLIKQLYANRNARVQINNMLNGGVGPGISRGVKKEAYQGFRHRVLDTTFYEYNEPQ